MKIYMYKMDKLKWILIWKLCWTHSVRSGSMLDGHVFVSFRHTNINVIPLRFVSFQSCIRDRLETKCEGGKKLQTLETGTKTRGFVVDLNSRHAIYFDLQFLLRLLFRWHTDSDTYTREKKALCHRNYNRRL